MNTAPQTLNRATAPAQPPAPAAAMPVLRDGKLVQLGKAHRRKPARHRVERVHFELPEQAQLAVLKFPAVRHYEKARFRLVCVQLFVALSNRMSAAEFARTVGISESGLCEWRKKYAAGGFDALIPKQGHRPRKARRGKRAPAQCTLEIHLPL